MRRRLTLHGAAIIALGIEEADQGGEGGWAVGGRWGGGLLPASLSPKTTSREVPDPTLGHCHPGARNAIATIMIDPMRARIAATAYALITQNKVAGLYDHAAGRHLPIAAEARGEHLQGFDGERAARFGGTLPEIYHADSGAYVSFAIEGTTAKSYDRASSSWWQAIVTGKTVQVYDHGSGTWSAFEIQTA